MELLSLLVLLGLVLFLLCLKEKKEVRRNKTEYDYDLVTYKNSIFIDVR